MRDLETAAFSSAEQEAAANNQVLTSQQARQSMRGWAWFGWGAMLPSSLRPRVHRIIVFEGGWSMKKPIRRAGRFASVHEIDSV